MSIWGIGVDVVDVDRFRETLERTPGVRERIFTAAEAALSVESMAARFAAKEALIKALKVPVALPWHDMEVVSDDIGAPGFTLTGTAAARADELGVTPHLSITHDGNLAAAFVVAELVEDGRVGA
ncbi:MAG TPA: holo-ACP synthase [Aeromicrobium sp.]|nr:holo-ACP synthase [Aeromicrobium sp.]